MFIVVDTDPVTCSINGTESRLKTVNNTIIIIFHIKCIFNSFPHSHSQATRFNLAGKYVKVNTGSPFI